MTFRIGSLFSGYGGLDMGVQAVLGGEIVWHCQYDPEDKFQYAARILAHHWPTVPNLGDITLVDWQRILDEHGTVDVLTGGFPCTDLSSAGQRAGLSLGTRSGLWHYMLRAIETLRPRLVVIENVRGILSTKATPGGVGPDSCCLEYAGGKPVLRALGAVLGDLAAVGFDAEWAGVRASEVGAAHERFREFVLAWPAAADADGVEPERRGEPGVVRGSAAAESREGDQRERAGSAARDGGQAVADAAHHGHERGGRARDGRAGPADGDQAAADAGRDEPGDDRELPARRHVVRNGLRDDAARRGTAAADAGHSGRRPVESDVRTGQPDVEWGDYEPAIRRWEAILGRPHPWPTDDRGRLAPEFSEWHMGVPAGHVCSVPPVRGMTEAALRNARLRALGNGVVPLQCSVAVRHLLDRVAPEVPLIRRLVAEAAHLSLVRLAA